jgi:Ca2+-binding RTX toxin-like protein
MLALCALPGGVAPANRDDMTGYLKATGWIKGDDAFLTLDRDYNGQFDSGRELFSNGTVALGRRGLAGLNWVDSNYDGRLTAADPVWNELKVWRDLDQDGAQDAGEVQGLDALGVSELNYAMGTFTQAGQQKQLASPDLEADKEGTRVTVVPEGILVQASADGHLSLLVTRIDDKTAVEANRDGVSGYEDVELIVSGADLLANDTLGGFLGRDLTLTGLTNLRHGTGFVDANGFVRFTPEANYAGNEAGFDYGVLAANGQEGTATVDITLQAVNDAPTLERVERTNRRVYGYVPVQYDEYGNYAGGGEAIYQPYGLRTTYQTYVNEWGTARDFIVYSVILDPPPGQWDLEYHLSPMAEEDSGLGRIVATDVDDPAASLAYEIVNQPQYGSVALDAQGNFQYVSWKEPGVPSDRIVVDGQYAGTRNGTLYTPSNLPGQAVYPTTDVFQVRITDPQGASTIQSITVPHFGPYLPPTPPGGGGGKKPIAVDLNGDGFEFVNVDDSNVFFDVNGDGWKKRTSWVAPDDGLLAYDIDGDGKIDRAGEISFARYKPGAQGDLEGLAAFDSNGDGIFSATDEKWSKFGVWQDANQDGITDAGELRSLSGMGVAAVQLASDGRFEVINGQTVRGVGAMDMADGSQLAIADVTFSYSNETKVELPDGTSRTVSRPPFSPSGELLEGTPDKDLILGKNGNNIVNAYAGDDVIFEDGGNDIIDGGDGNDLIYAGADNDLVMGGSGDDAVYAGLGSDLVLGGDGHDALFAEGGNDVAFGGAGNDLVSGGRGNDVLSGDAGNDQVYGESGNDALFGREGDDELAGMDDNDYLNGGDGNDLLDGGTGADNMIGGAGDDTYVVDDVADTVAELVAEGNDTVRAAIDYALGEHVENLAFTGTAALAGSGNALDNRLTGNAGANVLRGAAGADWLDGGLGSDTLIGGTGDDTYVVDRAGDAVEEAAGEGVDTVRAAVSYVLPDEVESLILTGAAPIAATGNALDNTLLGNAGDNLLDGAAGADVMQGGRGDDTYGVDQTGDRTVEAAGEGIDTVISGVSYALADHVENLVLTGTGNLDAAGNALDNLLLGNAGANRLDGGLGADAMAGGAGDDTYVVDAAADAVVESAGEGTDTVLAGASYALSDNVENLILAGTADLDGTGNALDNTLTGNAGDNRLDGAAGADVLAGGAGNDTYLVDDAGDTVVEAEGEGDDTVLASVTYTLVDHVENLMLTGAADIAGTGNALGNVLTGNSGNNTLDGAAGADALAGGAGDDLYYADDAGDTVTEALGEGDDTIRSTVSYAAPENVERIELLGAENLEATGNALDNTLAGNAGANRLDGAAGADLMAGGAGDDRYLVEDAGDQVIEALDDGYDTVESSASYAAHENVERVELTGDADIDATGNGLDNVLLGNAGANRLDGGDGADAMAGGAGDDTYLVDNAADTVAEAEGEGRDTVLASVTYTLTDHVENLNLTGGADIDGTGNALDNVLVGNAGENRLDGGAGADAMAGGAGDDDYIVDATADTVLEAADEGFDTIYSGVSYVLPEHVERLVLTGAADLDGTGNALDNVLIGNAGRNVLDGAAGADAMAAGQGDDDYIVDHAGDTVVEAAGAGVDSIYSSVSYVLSANVERLTLTGSADLDATGNALDNALTGNYGNNVLDGGAGADTMAGGQGDDTYRVDNAADAVREAAGEGIDGIYTRVSYVLPENVENLYLVGEGSIGGSGNGLDNRLTGNSGDNLIGGGGGNDLLDGQAGDDTYLINLGDGLDRIDDAAGADTVRFGAGLSLDNVALRVFEQDGRLTAQVRVLEAGGCEQAGQGFDFAVTADRWGRTVSPIERFEFADGSVRAFDDLLIKTRITVGSPWDREIATGRDDDIILAGPRNDVIRAGSGHDTVYAGPGGDTVYGEGGDDYLQGGTGDDLLDGGCGIDVLAGANGRDLLRDAGGSNAFLGGAQDDRIEAGGGNDFIAGGRHDDTIQAGGGANVVAFNRGDGRDTLLPGAGARNTLSLGGGIDADRLSFKQNGQDLILETGGSDRITFKDWYAGEANRNFVTLQLVDDGGRGWHRGETFDQQVETFDFRALTDRFDAARAATPRLSSWSLMNGLLDAHLSGSDEAALGGELAARYAQEGALAMAPGAVQEVLRDPRFGTQAQAVGGRFDASVQNFHIG